MRIYLLLFVFGIVLIFGCKDERDCFDGNETFTFQENRDIDLNFTGMGLQAQIVVGEKLVFKYIREVDCENVDDEESFEEVAFAINSNVETFKIETSEDFEISRCYLDRDGAWFQFTNQILQGEISGTKYSNKRWEVTFDLQLFHPGDTLEYRELIFSETFKRE